MELGKKLMLMGTGVAAAAAVASHGVTRELVKLAVDRKAPPLASAQARKRLTGGEVDQAFLRAAAVAGDKLRRRGGTLVQITASDGVTLVGHWLPAREPKRMVVAMHGWRSRWYHDFGMIADFLSQNDCSVLYPEQRGQGRSGGECMGLGALERRDCRDWAYWVVRQNPELPVYLAGISMGATTVMLAAGLDLPRQVRGIIADCGFTSPQSIGKHVVGRNLHLPYGEMHADWLCKKRNREGIRSCSTPAALARSKLPLLLIHGEKDRFVPVEMSCENYRAAQGPKELLVIPGADHAMSYYLAPERYQKAITRFCQKYDTRP